MTGLQSDNGRAGPENPCLFSYLRGLTFQGYISEKSGGRTFLSIDNQACLAWLADALQQLRSEGQTKAVGYLEAVLEEVVFEVEMDLK